MREYDKGYIAGYAAGVAWRHGMSPVESLLVETEAPKPRRKPRKKDPKMSRALKEANAKGRTSKGALRKGWSQSRIMSLAHKLRRQA